MVATADVPHYIKMGVGTAEDRLKSTFCTIVHPQADFNPVLVNEQEPALVEAPAAVVAYAAILDDATSPHLVDPIALMTEPDLVEAVAGVAQAQAPPPRPTE